MQGEVIIFRGIINFVGHKRRYSLLLMFTTRIIAIVAFCAGGAGIVDGVAILAGGIFMVDAISITTPGMGEGGIPITGVVALCAIGAEYPRMDGWFGMTGSADRG
jgi:hypothetical protein